jgi:hypothetical protein
MKSGRKPIGIVHMNDANRLSCHSGHVAIQGMLPCTMQAPPNLIDSLKNHCWHEWIELMRCETQDPPASASERFEALHQ